MQDSHKEKIEALLQEQLGKLSRQCLNYIEAPASVQDMERGLLQSVLAMCLLLLKLVIRARVEKHNGDKPLNEEGERILSKGKRIRKYLSLFGMLNFARPTYYSDRRGMLYPTDEELELPVDLWSYNLDELIGESGSEQDFRQSVRTVNSLLNLDLSGVGSERCIERMGEASAAYYEGAAVEQMPAGAVGCASFDGKGVPMIVPKNDRQPRARLKKGEKPGTKRMATVGVVSYVTPRPRSAQDIVRGLMKDYGERSDKQAVDKEENDNRWHQEIHRRAFLSDQPKSVDYGMARMKSMMEGTDNKFVVPVDAGVGLEDCILQSVEEHGLQAHFDGIILDIIHVTEYVWVCANAIFGEGSKLREDWVKDALQDILEGKTDKLIKDLQRVIDKTDLSDHKRQAVSRAVRYFTNHRHKMNYDEYLSKGYPVSSALVESNCRHFVKDRMERSGMRWSAPGAQHMLDSRAAVLNGDLTNVIDFTREQNRKIAA